MERNTAPEDAPASDWEFSHALQNGDELVDTNEDTPITVNSVNNDGSITCRVWIDQRHGQKYTRDTWTEKEVNCALADGIFKRVSDGKSHELSTF